MANKAANIDFGGAMSRMRQTIKEEPRQTEEQRVWENPDGWNREAPTPPVEERRGPGRKKKENNVRSNPKTIFFDNETDRAMSMIKVNDNIDKKDLVLAATRLFLDRYYISERSSLSEEGIQAVFSNLGDRKTE